MKTTTQLLTITCYLLSAFMGASVIQYLHTRPTENHTVKIEISDEPEHKKLEDSIYKLTFKEIDQTLKNLK